MRKKNNVIVVRVRKTDINYFNMDYGIFNEAANAARESNGDYWEYTVMGADYTQSNKGYAFLAKSANENSVPVWTETTTGKSFSGNVFYYTAEKKKGI